MNGFLMRLAAFAEAVGPLSFAALLSVTFLGWLLVLERCHAYGVLSWTGLPRAPWRRDRELLDGSLAQSLTGPGGGVRHVPSPEREATHTPHARFLLHLRARASESSPALHALEVEAASIEAEAAVVRGLSLLSLLERLLLLTGVLGVANGLGTTFQALARAPGGYVPAGEQSAGPILAAAAACAAAGPIALAAHFVRRRAGTIVEHLRASARRLTAPPGGMETNPCA